MFRLEKGETPDKDQFLPMGDNSPRSLDGRVWDGEKVCRNAICLSVVQC